MEEEIMPVCVEGCGRLVEEPDSVCDECDMPCEQRLADTMRLCDEETARADRFLEKIAELEQELNRRETCPNCDRDWDEDYDRAFSDRDRLQAELDEFRKGNEYLATDVLSFQKQLEASQAEVERLRSALKKYGRHVDMPGALNRARCLGGMSCVCGLDEALAADRES